MVGNRYDKYGTKNPLARCLMSGFLGRVTELARSVQPRSVLEVGCGEGLLSQHLFERLSTERFEACDLSLERVSPRCDPRIVFRAASADALPYADASFDLVVCCEVLEHLAEPRRAVSQLARVTQRWVLVSTPYEPIFRGMNLLRGAYLRDFGNTPGHVQHFGRRSLEQLLKPDFQLIRVTTPLPWIVVLAERK